MSEYATPPPMSAIGRKKNMRKTPVSVSRTNRKNDSPPRQNV